MIVIVLISARITLETPGTIYKSDTF